MKKKLLTLCLAATMITSFVGCNKDKTPDPAQDTPPAVTQTAENQPAEQPAEPAAPAAPDTAPAPAPAPAPEPINYPTLNHIDVADYHAINTEQSNSLLQFVPADTPILMASVGNFKYGTPEADAYFRKASQVATQYLDLAIKKQQGETIDAVQSAAPDIRNEMQAYGLEIIQNLEATKALIGDLTPQKLAEFGLSPTQTDTFVFYLTETGLPVIKMTFGDAQQLMTTIKMIFNKIGDMNVELTPYKIADQDWLLYGENEEGFIFNTDGGILTISVLFKNIEPSTTLLKPAAKPMTETQFKSYIGSNDISVAVVDTKKLVALFDKSSKARETYEKIRLISPNNDNQTSCIKDFNRLASIVPQLTMSSSLSTAADDLLISPRITATIADKEYLGILKKVRTAAPNLSFKPSDLGNFSAALVIPEMINLLKAVGKRVKQTPYTCRELKHELNDLADLDEMAGEIPPETYNVSAINVVLHELKPLPGDKYSIDLKLAVLGNNLAKVLQESMAKTESVPPEFANLKYENGTVNQINLERLDLPVTMQLLFTEKGVYVANSGEDIKALSEVPTSDTQMASIGISNTVLPLVGDAYPELSLVGAFVKRLSMNLNIEDNKVILEGQIFF